MFSVRVDAIHIVRNKYKKISTDFKPVQGSELIHLLFCGFATEFHAFDI
jgi:hypothetical protein